MKQYFSKSANREFNWFVVVFAITMILFFGKMIHHFYY